MPISWTADELEQNRKMNASRSGRIVPKGPRAIACGACRARRNPLSTYRADDGRKLCRPCLTGEPVTIPTAPAPVKVRKARAPRPAVVAPVVEPETVPDALTLCNACDVNPADPESPAGYCAACERDAHTPEPTDAPDPSPEPDTLAPYIVTLDNGQQYRFMADDYMHAREQAHNAEPDRAVMAVRLESDPEPAQEPEPVSIAPEPVAPVLAALPTLSAPDGRPTCERCGQVFRKHGTGAEWHRVNRPDCAGARPAVSIAS